MKLQRYSSFEDAAALQSAWDQLVEQTGGDIFASYDWCAVWWRHYGSRRRLHLFVAFEGDEVVGVLPLFSETRWAGPVPVRAIRLVGCDHSVTTCGFAVQVEHAREVIHAVVARLNEDMNWDLMQLGPLSAQQSSVADVVSALGSASDIARAEADTRRYGEQMLIELPDGFDAYLNAVPRNERRGTQRRARKLEQEHGMATAVTGTNGDARDAFDRLVTLHQQQWTAIGQLGHFRDWPGATAFHRDMLAAQSRHGRCHFVELRSGDELLATQYEYRFGRRLHAVLAARTLDERWSHYSPGKLVHMASVENAIKAGCRVIDDMRGRYEYKERLGGAVSSLQSVSVYRRGALRSARIAAFRTIAWGVDVIYNKIWFCRIATRARLKKRPLWTWWIRSKL